MGVLARMRVGGRIVDACIGWDGIYTGSSMMRRWIRINMAGGVATTIGSGMRFPSKDIIPGIAPILMMAFLLCPRWPLVAIQCLRRRGSFGGGFGWFRRRRRAARRCC